MKFKKGDIVKLNPEALHNLSDERKNMFFTIQEKFSWMDSSSQKEIYDYRIKSFDDKTNLLAFENEIYCAKNEWRKYQLNYYSPTRKSLPILKKNDDVKTHVQ